MKPHHRQGVLGIHTKQSQKPTRPCTAVSHYTMSHHRVFRLKLPQVVIFTQCNRLEMTASFATLLLLHPVSSFL